MQNPIVCHNGQIFMAKNLHLKFVSQMNKNKIHRKHYLSLKIYTKTNDQGVKDMYKDDKVFYPDIIHPNLTSKRSKGFYEKLKIQIELKNTNNKVNIY